MVNDQFGSPTWTEDLADATMELIKKECAGTYHVVNSGEFSWYDFACRIGKEADFNTKVIPCTIVEFRRKRPSYLHLSTKKVDKLIFVPLPNWTEPL